MLSFKYIPYREHYRLGTDQKLNKIFGVIRKDKIVLMQGKLKAEEEAKLIERTMSQITKDFTGISFCTIHPNSNGKKKTKKKDFMKSASETIGNIFYKALLSDRDCLTIVGPANVIGEIRKNPSQIDLFLK